MAVACRLGHTYRLSVLLIEYGVDLDMIEGWRSLRERVRDNLEHKFTSPG